MTTEQLRVSLFAASQRLLDATNAKRRATELVEAVENLLVAVASGDASKIAEEASWTRRAVKTMRSERHVEEAK